MFYKNGVLRNFTKFTRKYLCQRCFPVNFAKSIRTPFFTEHLGWLLLKLQHPTDEGKYFIERSKGTQKDQRGHQQVQKIFRKANVCVRIRGLEMLVSGKGLRMYLMDDPKQRKQMQDLGSVLPMIQQNVRGRNTYFLKHKCR